VTVNNGVVNGIGTVTGSLTVNGTLAPGNSPGAITINGNLNLTSASVLNIELGGTAQGTGYDYVNVTGVANLAGTLNVTSFGGYVAPAGTTFTFMNFGSTTGSFATINLPAGWNLSYLTGVTDLALLANALTSSSAIAALVSQTSAAALTPDSVSLVLQRVDATSAPLETLTSPPPLLVSVEKPIAEEACP
jgi:hypothetical protein